MSAPALRFLEVRGDRMQPLLYRGDFALVAPANRWLGEGEYVLLNGYGEEVIYTCDAVGTRAGPSVRLHSANKLYPDQYMTKAAFESAVVSKVVMLCHVVDHSILTHHALAA